MNALEPEPEGRGRVRRLAIGLAIALGIGSGVVLAADRITPTRKMLSDVVKIAVIDSPPPEQPEPPKPPTPVPPPPTRPKPQPKARPQPAPAAVPEPIEPTDTPPPEPVGLDADSFGSGTGGPAFAVGTTQMGAPGEAARSAEPPKPKPKPKLIEARTRPGNRAPTYTERARRLNIQGLMVIETDVDAYGRVTRAVVRGKLDPLLDEDARRTVLNWQFDPATLDGRPIASTKWLRIRFVLE